MACFNVCFYTFMHAFCMQKGVERSGPRLHANLQDIRTILVQKLRGVLEKTATFKLDCQARLGSVVWLGDLIELGQRDRHGMVLRQFEGLPKYEDGKIRLKNEYYTRYDKRPTLRLPK